MRTPEEVKAGRAASARKRRADPVKGEEIRLRQIERYHRIGHLEQKARLAHRREHHFFRWRAQLWSTRFKVRVTAWQLARLWIDQRGRCALSGRRLTRKAHLDHITPIAADGSHEIANLRWLDPDVNRARRNLTDAEFLQLCRDVIG